MRQTKPKTMGQVEWILLLVLSMLWGGSFFFGEVALNEVQPFTVVFVRVALAAVVLHLVVLSTGQRMPRSGRMWGKFFAMGFLNNLLPFSLIFWGQTQIASGLASILNATTPLWTVVLAHFFTRDERLTSGRLAGVTCGLLGVTVMIGPDALSGLGLNAVAQLAVLAAALSYAVAGIYGKQFQGVPPLITAAGQVTATALMMIPVVLIVDQPWTEPWPSAITWGALVGLAVLSTSVAYIIYFRLLSTAGATNLLLVTFLIPVSALLLGVFILGERLDVRQWGGMALIGLGLVFIDGRVLAVIRQPPQKKSLGYKCSPLPDTRFGSEPGVGQWCPLSLLLWNLARSSYSECWATASFGLSASTAANSNTTGSSQGWVA